MTTGRMQPRVLMVDDVPANLIALEAALEGLDCELVRASSGNDALRALLRGAFAVVLLDVQMPGMDGYEVARWARQAPSTQNVPIIFLTALHEREESALRGYGSGAVDVLFKPIDPTILRSKVQVFLDLHAGRQRLALEVAAHEQTMVELRRASRLKSDFLSNMSHELRTPLNAVIGFAEVLLGGAQGPLEEAQRRSVLDIEAAGRQLLLLVNDILDLSKIEAGHLEITMSDFDLGVTAHEATTLVSTQARRKTITLENAISSAWCKADVYRTRQVVTNLLSNAVKFTPEGGTVRLSAEANEDFVKITVADSGIGISDADAARLFQPFTQVDAARAGGTGLGLSICRRLVEAMGGSIAFSSKLGEGSKFWFSLPCGGSGGTSERPTEVEAALSTARGRVLVVDDVQTNRRVVRAMLAPEGFEILEADSAEAALRLARDTKPDLVLMDIRMPDVDGLEATRRFRADADLTQIPIVALSAQAMVGDRERSLEAGCVAHVVKPVGRKELLDVVASAIESARLVAKR